MLDTDNRGWTASRMSELKCACVPVYTHTEGEREEEADTERQRENRDPFMVTHTQPSMHRHTCIHSTHLQCIHREKTDSLTVHTVRKQRENTVTHTHIHPTLFV